MKGILLDFSIKDNIGYISGNDGNRYEFVGKEWREDVLPMKGGIVDFDIDVDGKAIKIYSVIQSTLNTNKTESFEITEEYTRQLEGEKSYGTMSWFKKCMRNYVDFSGRARRSEFWNFVLMVFFIQVIPSIIIGIITYFITANQYRYYSYYGYSGGFGINDVAQIFGIAFVMSFLVICIYCFVCSCIFLLPGIAVTVRRLHDIGLPGWWASLIILTYISPLLILMGGIIFAMIVYIVVSILFIVWCSTDTKPQSNQWGLPPK